MQQKANCIIWICIMYSSMAASYAQQPKLMLPVGHVRGIYNAAVSPDEKIIATASSDRTVKIWEANSGRLLYNFDDFSSWVYFARFSPDGSKMITSSGDKTVSVWDTKSFKVIYKIGGFENDVRIAEFSPDSKTILTVDWHHSLQLWEVVSGKSIFKIYEKDKQFEKALFSPDGKFIASTFESDSLIEIREAASGKIVRVFKGSDFIFNNNGKRLATFNKGFKLEIWDIKTGKNTGAFDTDVINGILFSPDNTRVVLVTINGAIQSFNLESGKWAQLAKIENMAVGRNGDAGNMLRYSKDANNIFIASPDDNIIYNVNEATGKIVSILRGHSDKITSMTVLNNGREILTSSADKTAIIWNAETGKGLIKFNGRNNEKSSPVFSPGGKYFINNSTTAKMGGNHFMEVWNTVTGKKIFSINSGREGLYNPGFSEDEQTMSIYAETDSAFKLFELSTGRLLKVIKAAKQNRPGINELKNHFIPNNYPDPVMSGDGEKMIKRLGKVCEIWLVKENKKLFSLTATGDNNFSKAEFSPDGSKIIVSDYGNNIQIVDAGTQQVLKNIQGFIFSTNRAQNMLAAINKSSIDFYNNETYSLLYRVVAIDSTDYVVMDKDNHYDGTEAARKLVYFTCGSEVIELDQVKDQLWVPNLAERIMKGDPVNAKTLDDLNICGFTPQVESTGTGAIGYDFTIAPRRGGLGETVLYVNGIEAKRYKPAQLHKTGKGFELKVGKEELSNYFIPGQENVVTIKAYTSDNAVSSRGVKINDDKTKKVATPPNLYAVMVGVSDYKGDELDLKFAAKDATDISNAVSHAAKKLLNTDGRDHVFMYNLTTDRERYQLPEKNSIKKILGEIGKKATASDILLIFFAGHGVMSGSGPGVRAGAHAEGEYKQFYFLTADASKASSTSAIADVGISTSELTEWMKPQNIKAQKRILIFDACNSGQAINDFVKMGNGDQNYLAARSDDNAQQIKAIDKLNEKSGLFILSASSSNQSAYEMGRYSQGLLTYSLLKAIKQQPDILEDGKLLNVSRWFNAAEKTVSELAKESGARQEPQIVSNTNFNIGLVDEDVIAKIILPSEKPLFAASNFQNSDEAVADDDLEFSKQINLHLNELAARGMESKIVYVTATNSPDAYSLSGRYTIKGNAISVTVNIKQNKVIKSKFELSGTTEKLHELAAAIADKAAVMVK